MTSSAIQPTLNLRAGDWVEVRSAEEILSTLDPNGALDELPFMPEMLPFCGKRLQVYATAHKTCDTIKDWRTIRRMSNAVHLGDLRCDGAAHGGCQAACLLFWKEAWLRPVDGPRQSTDAATNAVPPQGLVMLQRATKVESVDRGDAVDRYRCQATQHVAATEPMKWWDPRHYVRDLTSGNVSFGTWVKGLAVAAYNNVMRRVPGGRIHPYVKGTAGEKTPSQILNIQPGEIVRVKSPEQIMPTIDAKRKNRGMIFDEEMMPFCGQTFRVKSRVDHIINERTGEMMKFGNPCLTLEGVYCGGCLSRYRLFCKRAIPPYWREIWVERVTPS